MSKKINTIKIHDGIVNDYLNGGFITEIAKKYKMFHSAVRLALIKNNVKIDERRKPPVYKATIEFNLVDENGFKKCNRCFNQKILTSFHKKKPKVYSLTCRACCSKRTKINYLKNKSHYLNYHNKYRLRNAEKIKSKHDKDYQKKRNREYYVKNKKSLNKKKNEYFKKRRSIDPCFKIKCYLRNRIGFALKRSGEAKKDKSMNFIGCSVSELKKRLQSKFLPGMTWDNYGKWHVDHIKPCASFDLSDENQQKECFSYTNLQPLWACDNLRKGDRW